MRCLDACVEVCYCARMGSIWSAHTRISLPFLKVRIRMTDLWIHVVLQCEKGSLRNGEKGECPSMANPACFWREDCPGYVKLSAAIQWEKLHRCQKQGVKAHDVMEFVSYDIHRRLFSFLHAHISQRSETLWAWGRHMPSDVPNSIEPQGAKSHSVSAPFNTFLKNMFFPACLLSSEIQLMTVKHSET